MAWVSEEGWRLAVAVCGKQDGAVNQIFNSFREYKMTCIHVNSVEEGYWAAGKTNSETRAEDL